jgi:EAL domain-containing protein (putative c-di-GMP-specific phosphodiesterase class I)/signal transduction histidine kinase
MEGIAESVAGAFRCLEKPVDADVLRGAVRRALHLQKLSQMKPNALQSMPEPADVDDEEHTQRRAGLRARFERALGTLWVAFQPIVRASDRSVFGYEALLRTDEPSLPEPSQVLDAAEHLGELERLGRAVRERAVEPLGRGGEVPLLFLNLHPHDLSDPEFMRAATLLSDLAPRVVLEITERAPLDQVENLRARIARLREVGFRIAVDDLGAGYAGLTSFALLEPEIVKLDMSLVRDVDTSPVKQKLVASMLTLCRDMGLLIVAEGVETFAERDTLLALGCDLFQGYLFGRPGRAFPEPSWDGFPLLETPVSGTHRVASNPPRAVSRERLFEVSERAGEQVVPVSLLDGLGDGVLLVNAEGRVVFANPAAQRILGVEAPREPARPRGESCGVFSPDGQDSFPAPGYPLVRALAGEATDNVEMLVRKPNDARSVLISATGRPLRDPEGAICGASVVFRDVGALRRAEQEAGRASADLRAAQRRQAELSAFMVHDLKSPLTAILGSVSVLLEGPPTAGEERDCLRDIRDSALSMHRMVLDLLDVHTAEDGALAAEFEPVHIAELLEEVLLAMAPRAAQRGQRVDLVLATEEVVVFADRELLRRVLQNLVDNCMKYGPTGGRIALEARLGAGERVVFSVRDEGPGVPVALRERIFEKYAQLERDAGARQRDSRGLGLRFCQVAVEAHGGRVWVEDNVPKGACFCVELPLAGPGE